MMILVGNCTKRDVRVWNVLPLAFLGICVSYCVLRSAMIEAAGNECDGYILPCMPDSRESGDDWVRPLPFGDFLHACESA